MKTITTYEAFDGKVFATEEECRNHEKGVDKALKEKVHIESICINDHPYLYLFDEIENMDWYTFSPTCMGDIDAVIDYLMREHPFCESVNNVEFVEGELYLADYNGEDCSLHIMTWSHTKEVILADMNRFEASRKNN